MFYDYLELRFGPAAQGLFTKILNELSRQEVSLEEVYQCIHINEREFDSRFAKTLERMAIATIVAMALARVDIKKFLQS